ncbi:hypothetical protein UVI_02055490 [Ustilaginoidea virens]|uniref:Transcription elongation factor Eaf N-terminal domain-containing protein n=1 Tax=Ustilaginoidea virens TaxID=1159556 RepID=A0A1B5KY25_USTVR|nr:hypothetical protein UVI_02055490 [Ustilaginoidea virens]
MRGWACGKWGWWDNHKPTLSSDDAPSHSRLKPSFPGKTDSYDLSFTDDDGSYAYTGSRNTNSDQYVLHFDAERKAFILDKIDSTFNLNVARLPGISDSERLRRQYPHLDSQPAPKRSVGKKTISKAAPKAPTSKSQAKETKRKTDKKQQQPPKEAALSFPKPEQKPEQKPKPKSNSFEDEEDEEEDDDDDGGLLIEYPGGDTAKQTDFSPAFPQPRRFDDFMDQRDSEADDADGESDDEPDADFKLPSPANLHNAQAHPMDVEEGSGVQRDDSIHDMGDDLEKDMEMAFEDMANTPEGGDESEISEED